MEKHIRILALVYLVFHTLTLLAAFLIFGLLSGFGVLTGSLTGGGILVMIGVIVAFMMGLMAVPGLIGGYGLLKRRSWARILVLVLGYISVFQPPFGTLLGLYTLWVLLHQDTTRLFSR